MPGLHPAPCTDSPGLPSSLSSCACHLLGQVSTPLKRLCLTSPHAVTVPATVSKAAGFLSLHKAVCFGFVLKILFISVASATAT